MSECPVCIAEIPEEIILDGGHCPSCGELILGEWDENEVTELFTIDDVTEQFDITQPIPDDLSDQTEDHSSEEDFGISVPQKPTVVNIDAPLNSLGGMKGYVMDDEESSEELLELPSREEAGLEPQVQEKKTSAKTKSNSNGLVLVAIVLFVLGAAGATASSMFKAEEKPPEPSYENKEITHFVPEIEVKEAEVKKEEPEKVVQKKKTTKKKETTSKKIENEDSFGVAIPSRPKATTKTATKNISEKLREDIGKLQGSLQYCHTRALRTDPTARGKWEVSFTVDTAGKASGLNIKSLRKKNTDIEACMESRIKRYSFSKPPSPSDQVFRVTFG